jgi:outer membrane protein assembly factor BamB
MSSTTHLEFACTVCKHPIVGDYEEEDFENPVFCPKCGRPNSLSKPASIAAPPNAPPQPTPPAIRPNTAAPVPTTAPTPTRPVSDAAKTPPAMPQPTPEVRRVAAPAREPVPRAPTVAAAVSPRRSSERVAWRFPASGAAPTNLALRNCAAVDEQGGVIAALGRELVALVPGPDQCRVAWKFTAADAIPGSPVLGSRGVVFAHSNDGLLHALDATGKPIRPPGKVGPPLGWATPLVDAENTVWLSAATGGLVRIDAAGQTTARPFLRSPSRFDCTGVLRGRALYIGSEDQFLHAVDLSGNCGRERWDQRQNVGRTGWYINSAVAVAAGRLLIVVSRDDHVSAFEEDGRLVWRTPLPGRALGSPVAGAAEVVIGLAVHPAESAPSRGLVVALNALTGEQTWSCEFDDPIESTPVIGETGEIYLGDNGGAIHALSAAGQRLWSESVGAGVRSAGTLLPSGQVLFGLDDGSLVALRCNSRQLAAGWPKLLGTASGRCPSVP